MPSNLNVNFRRGSQSDLNTKMAAVRAGTATYDAGSFYLTSDSHRLYFAQTTTQLELLNQTIHTVATIGDLPTLSTRPGLQVGDIYYVTGTNALAVCKSTSPVTWQQLNPDTYLLESSSAITVTGSNSDQTQTIGMSVSDTQDGSSANQTVSGSFALVAGSNVQFAKNGNQITISSTDTNDNATYSIGTTASTATLGGKLKLSGSGTGASDSTVTIKGASGSGISVTSDANGNIEIDGGDIVDSVTNAFSSAGAFTTTLGMSATGTVTSTAITPTITYGQAATPSSATFNSGTAHLDIYTKSEVDGLISTQMSAANAMTYKGTVSNTNVATKLGAAGSSANTYAGNVGDTYKASTDLTAGSNGSPVTANTGDLIIATGVDGAVVWEVVPSGDDQLIDVQMSSSNNTFSILDNSDVLGQFTFANGTNINVTSAVDSSTSTKTYTIAHATPSGGTAVSIATATNGTTLSAATNGNSTSSLTIPVITSISKDSTGHITSITGQNYVVVDSHGSIDSINYTVGVTGSTATITNTTTFDAVAEQGAFKIQVAQDSLQVSSPANDTVKLELVWGSF